MLDDIKELRTFVNIVGARSLSAAARDMNLALSVVSKRLASLERRAEARLIARSTRRLALTEEGQANDCEPIVSMRCHVTGINAMSALPPKADLCGATSNVRYGPIADSCTAANSIAIRSLHRRDRLACWGR
jgi:hypothetical protein